jgi:hypothetical protein
VFQLARTFSDPSSEANSQRGFPAPGSGAQRTGDYPSPAAMARGYIPSQPERPTQGFWSFLNPGGHQGSQAGFPVPGSPGQQRRGWGPGPAPQPRPFFVRGPRFSEGTQRDVPNVGRVYSNPIGAGVVALHRPQASYGNAAQYVNGTIWWTSQGIPTSVRLSGLTNPAALAAVLGPINVQAAVRVG